MIYGYARTSTKKQKLDRQLTNIRLAYQTAVIKTEQFTGTTMYRPEWEKLKKRLVSGDTIVFDSVSRMSRNADEGFADYQELFDLGITLIFLKEPHINTDVYKTAMSQTLHLEVSTGNVAVDEYFQGNIELVNKLLMKLARQQIKLAFEESEQEVKNLHQRISEGIRESKANGKQIGLTKGSKLTTQKSIDCKEIIRTHSKSFGGSLSDDEVRRLCGCSRNSYYKYKKEIQT